MPSFRCCLHFIRMLPSARLSLIHMSCQLHLECPLVPNTMSAVPRARFYRVHFTNALWGKKFYDKLALLGT